MSRHLHVHIHPRTATRDARFRPGQLVKYARPGAGEAGYRFKVLEANEDANPPRVKIESTEPMTKGSRFYPIEVVSPEELVPA